MVDVALLAAAEVALAVCAELGSAGLLSWHQCWCPHQSRRLPKAACPDVDKVKTGRVAKRCILQIETVFRAKLCRSKEANEEKVLRRGGTRFWWILQPVALGPALVFPPKTAVAKSSLF